MCNYMKPISVFWYRKRNVAFGNFGDELGPYVVARLSGRPIRHIPIPRTGVYLMATLAKHLLWGRFDACNWSGAWHSLFRPGAYLTTIGSIIGWASGPRTVWGSGILFYNEKIANGRFLAVRGEYTRRRLQSLGYDCPDVVGDPALLLPLIYRPVPASRVPLAIIPHHTQYHAISAQLAGSGVRVINLLGDVEAIIDDIVSCERVVSMSLHGLIVAHAYGVPALWFEYPSVRWHGSDVKFYDYFSAVGIREYIPFTFPQCGAVDAIVLAAFDKAKDASLIGVDLALLQKKLLDVAPFDVRPECLAQLGQRWEGRVA